MYIDARVLILCCARFSGFRSSRVEFFDKFTPTLILKTCIFMVANYENINKVIYVENLPIHHISACDNFSLK